jgi:6,7-dimethyl-8-ribityllumazine synthase
VPTIEGDLSPPKRHFAIVAAKFNAFVVDALVSGSLEGLKACGVAGDRVDVVRVPGAFEIPLVAKTLAAGGKYAAVICLGAVIRGDTDHYDYVASAATDGVLRAGLDTGVPVIFGVLTCDDEAQALDRAGGPAGNKGFDCAQAAVEMVNLLEKLTSA